MSSSTPAASPSATSDEQNVATALHTVQARISALQNARNCKDVQLVAVSKTKPNALVQAAYDAGQRHFGENYVQEVVQKAGELPNDILWHFIGPLQSNKAKLLASVENLHVVESIDRVKTAMVLDKAVAASGRAHPLDVMVQVNTSDEESKSGCACGEAVEVAQAVAGCERLRLVGLMTIGAPDDSEEPEAFRRLVTERDAVAAALGRDSGSLSLSMGMSNDFEAAIRMGSNSVRVGSTIFGARNYNR